MSEMKSDVPELLTDMAPCLCLAVTLIAFSLPLPSLAGRIRTEGKTSQISGGGSGSLVLTIILFR